MASHSLRIARKDLRDVFRERTLLMALVLQLFIAGFSSFLLVGLVNLYDPEQAERALNVRVAYLGKGGFDEQLRNESTLRVFVTDPATALRLFDQGRVGAIVEEIYDDPSGNRTVNLLLPDGELQTTLLVTLLKDHLKEYERTLRGERAAQLSTQVVYVEPPAEGNQYFAFTYALLLPLLMLVPCFLSGAIAVDAITQEIQNRTLELLRASPVSAASLLGGKLVAPVILAPAQGALWMVLLRFNGIQIANPLVLLAAVTALATLLVCISVSLGIALRKQGDAQVAFSLLVLLFFGASYLLPQPLLATFARVSVGSLGAGELLSLGIILGAAGLAVAAVLGLSRRLLARVY